MDNCPQEYNESWKVLDKWLFKWWWPDTDKQNFGSIKCRRDRIYEWPQKDWPMEIKLREHWNKEHHTNK